MHIALNRHSRSAIRTNLNIQARVTDTHPPRIGGHLLKMEPLIGHQLVEDPIIRDVNLSLAVSRENPPTGARHRFSAHEPTSLRRLRLVNIMITESKQNASLKV